LNVIIPNRKSKKGNTMSQNLLTKFPRVEGNPNPAIPTGWTILSGAPIAQGWRFYASADEKKLAGNWRCSVGAFRVNYAKWEFCHILSGKCVITRDGGEPIKLGAGDSFVIEKGFVGIWEVIEAMEKRFVFVAD
jgi:uncharacterized cupin superfamily protein